MLGTVSQNNVSGNLYNGFTIRANAVGSFADALSSAVGNSGDGDFLSAAPDSWITGIPEGHSARGKGVANAVKLLKSMGLDPTVRVPTHSLTDEQKKWLRLRHSPDAIDDDGSDWRSEELHADLVYLGVISPEEANGIGVVALPAHCSSYSGLFESLKIECNSDGYLGWLRDTLSDQKDITDWVIAKYNNRDRRQDADSAFIEKEREHIAFEARYICLVEELFDELV